MIFRRGNYLINEHSVEVLKNVANVLLQYADNVDEMRYEMEICEEKIYFRSVLNYLSELADEVSALITQENTQEVMPSTLSFYQIL